MDDATFQLIAVLSLGGLVLAFTAVVQYFNLREPRSPKGETRQPLQTSSLL